MFRQEQLWVWMLALVTAGMGWNLHLAAWAVEMNLWGAAVWAFGSEVTAKAALPYMVHLYETAGLGSLIILSAGMLTEATNSYAAERHADVRA